MAEITRIPAGLNITASVGDTLLVAVTVTKNGTPFDLSGWTLEAENAELTILDAEQGELQLAFTADKPQTRAWSIRRASPQPKRLIAGFVVFTTTAGDSTADALTLQLEDGEDELTLEIFDPVQGLQPGDNVSELVNDAGYITAAEAPVQSVNGFTGEVSLTLDQIDDVQIDSITEGDIIRYDSTAGRWENAQLGTAADADVSDFDPAGSAAGVQSNLETHIDDSTNPHQVTAEQVGLGNVDDTSDLDKPISTATQAALDDKADKTTQVIAGTGLDGGGDLSEDRTFNLDSATVASLGKADSALQSGDNVSELTNDAAYITLTDLSASGDLVYNNETGNFSVTTYKSTDFANDLATKDTGDLTEGTNLYFTTQRIDDHLTGGTGVDYSAGNISLDASTIASLGLADTALQAGDNITQLTNDANYIDAAGAPVQSVNGETGVVVLDASDMGYDNSQSGLEATNVQDAIDEVVDEQGTMSTQNANNVNLTGGTIAGVNVSNLARTDAAQTFTGRQTFSGTDGLVIPVGTTAQRSGSPAVGLARLNTSLGIMEYYDGTVWRGFGEQFIEIGTPMGGGYFAGYISTSANGVPTHYLIVAPKATGENLSIAYGPTDRSDPTSFIDGPANTATLVATGDAPAAQFCAGLNIGGFTDWYMPARYELDVLYFSLKPTTANNRADGENNAGINPNAVPKRNAFFTAVGPPRQTTAAQFRDGNSEPFVAGFYWSSSQFSTGLAFVQSFANGRVSNFSTLATKTLLNRVRAVRRIAI